MNKRVHRFIALALSLSLLAGCAASAAESAVSPVQTSLSQNSTQTGRQEFLLEDEATALAAAPAAVPAGLAPTPSGVLINQNERGIIDYSNTSDGYVMVQYTAVTDKRLKVQVKGPTTTYTYNLEPQKWVTFPLSDGNGQYQIKLFQNIRSNRYSLVLSVSCSVSLSDEFAPFLRPNQYVDYEPAANTIAKAAQITQGITEPLKKVEAVYNFVVSELHYDYNLAATVKTGYLPVLDTVLSKRSGICFDYAALMTGMLRSLGVPCKLVVGYAGSAYHAWISVWSEKTGWVDGAIYFDGIDWHRMDPTFASTGKKSNSILEYIENEHNYTAKYFY